VPIVIVAIPAMDDYVWKISSEKIPHLTIMNLGDDLKNIDRVQEFIGHVVDTSLPRFGMDVDHRGLLGDKDADVLFFADHGRALIQRFQTYLLNNTEIYNAYHSTEQFPQWTPHLTLGYPATPAKPDSREYPGITWVNFDRVALWTGDYEGMEFPLKTDNALEMTDMRRDVDVLAHYGIKGMHWGRRKDRSSGSGAVAVTTHVKPGHLVKTEGGKHHPPHEDAVRIAISRQKAHKSTTDALSTTELRDLVNRMYLERQYSDLIKNDPRARSEVQKALKAAGGAVKTYNNVTQFLNSPAGKAVKKIVVSQLKTQLKSKVTGH